jgi:hypothetical protein
MWYLQFIQRRLIKTSFFFRMVLKSDLGCDREMWYEISKKNYTRPEEGILDTSFFEQEKKI